MFWFSSSSWFVCFTMRINLSIYYNMYMASFITIYSIMITSYCIPPSVEPFNTLSFLPLFKQSFSKPSPKLSQPDISKFFKLGHVKKVLVSSKSIHPLKFKSFNCDDWRYKFWIERRDRSNVGMEGRSNRNLVNLRQNPSYDDNNNDDI